MRVSCAIMAHPARSDLVAELTTVLDRPSTVVWDRRNEEWDTGVRAWQAYDPDADWHLVIQDDSAVCSDLLTGLEEALEHIPAASVVSLYVGNTRPYQNRIVRIVDDANRQAAAWIRMKALIWGPAIAAPVSTIDRMLEWCEDNHVPNYDNRLARYYEQVLRWPAYFTWPSLVDHRQVPSLLEHDVRGKRHAHKFLGAEASALDVDWSGPVACI